jgi:MFS family permease
MSTFIRSWRNSSGDSAQAGSRIAAWYATAVLMVAYVFAFLDRQILSLLIEPIKHDLHLNDTQMSLLQGIAFAALLALVGLPIGRLVDTRRRTTLITLGTAFWSLMTAGCGLAHSYSHLLLCRMGVGVGEACLTPSAYSLLADWFPPRRHGLVFGIYGIGAYIGLGLSFVIGGELIRRIGPLDDAALPWMGVAHPWRLVFMAVGLPGLLVAGWVATLPEPGRRRVGPDAVAESSLVQVYRYFRAQWQPILLVNLCVACGAMAAYSLSAWIPSFFIRTYGWRAEEIAARFGIVVAVAGILGYIVSGWAGDALATRGITAGRINIIVAAASAACPLAIAAPLMVSPWHALALYGATIFLVTMTTGLGPAAQLA